MRANLFEKSASRASQIAITLALVFVCAQSCWAQDGGAPTSGQADSADAATPAAGSTVVPRLIKFSGVLKGEDGRPVSRPAVLTFSLYEQPEGGAPLWSEIQTVQVDSQGRYTVLLGAAQEAGLPLDLFSSGQARWLGVEADVAGAAEPSRVLLVGVPYALKAADADTLGGKPASAFLLAGAAAASGSALGTTAGAQNLSHATSDTGTSPRRANSSSTTPTPLAIGGSGIFSFIPMWTPNGSTLGNSAMFQVGGPGLGGNVGLGTTTPSAKLDVEAPATTTPGIQGVTSSTAFFAAGVFGHATGASGLTRGVYGVADSPSGIGVHGIAATGGQFETGSGLILKGRGFGHDQFLLDANGNMRLSGGISAGGSGTIQVDAPGIAGGRFTILPNGNVGVGVVAPRSILEADANAASKLGPSLTLTNTGGGGGAASSVDFNTYSPSSTGTYNPSARIEARDNGDYSNTIIFQANNPGAPNHGLTNTATIDQYGDLSAAGSGTFGPTPQTAGTFLSWGNNILVGQTCFESCFNVFRVDGNGKGYFDGGTQTGGADFAESVAVAGDHSRYHPGDLLRVDPKSDRRLQLTDKPYSTLVAGIYSTKPGMLATPHKMDDSVMASEVPLAVVGIVPCKVSTENGPVRRGDLLVSSSTPGYAMKGTDRSRMLGAVVGKALEPLGTGKGVIEVLVTLQ